VFNVVTRLERLEHLAQKFKHRCEIHEEWSEGKEDMLQSQDFKRCRLNDVKVRFSMCDCTTRSSSAIKTTLRTDKKKRNIQLIGCKLKIHIH